MPDLIGNLKIWLIEGWDIITENGFHPISLNNDHTLTKCHPAMRRDLRPRPPRTGHTSLSSWLRRRKGIPCRVSYTKPCRKSRYIHPRETDASAGSNVQISYLSHLLFRILIPSCCIMVCSWIWISGQIISIPVEDASIHPNGGVIIHLFHPLTAGIIKEQFAHHDHLSFKKSRNKNRKDPKRLWTKILKKYWKR